MRPFTFSPTAYGPAVAALLTPPRLSPLGPGGPDEAVGAALRTFDPLADLGRPVARAEAARACHAGLWLYHDFLDESHTVSQDLETAEGSFWHAILHRREPDASNASYWFRRVGQHPVFPALVREAEHLGLRLRSGHWNPFDFVDWCEQHRGTGTGQEMLLRQVQQREWELLFDWCYTLAVETG